MQTGVLQQTHTAFEPLGSIATNTLRLGMMAMLILRSVEDVSKGFDLSFNLGSSFTQNFTTQRTTIYLLGSVSL
jgi:hypothetical protein